MTPSELSIKEITPAQLQELLAQDDPPVVLDVRETEELSICTLRNFIHISLRSLPQELERLPMDQTIVVLCHHGARSFHAAIFLRNHGYAHVLNLKGGIHAWAEQVDPSMARY